MLAVSISAAQTPLSAREPSADEDSLDIIGVNDDPSDIEDFSVELDALRTEEPTPQFQPTVESSKAGTPFVTTETVASSDSVLIPNVTSEFASASPEAELSTGPNAVVADSEAVLTTLVPGSLKTSETISTNTAVTTDANVSRANVVDTPTPESSNLPFQSETANPVPIIVGQQVKPVVDDKSAVTEGATATKDTSVSDETNLTSLESEKVEEALPQKQAVTTRNSSTNASARLTSEIELHGGSQIDVSTAGDASAHVDSANTIEPLVGSLNQTSNVSTTRSTHHANSSVSNFGASEVSQQVTDHMLSARQSIRDGRSQLEVTLDPPELGKITIELTEVDDILKARLFVAETTTLESIRSTITELLDSLTEAGITLDDMQLESFHHGNHSENAETGTTSAAEKEDSEHEGDWRPSGPSLNRVNILA